MDQSNMQVSGKRCECKHHSKWMVGLAVVLFGLSFLLERFGVLSPDVVSIIWPVLVILFGIRFFCGCCRGCECGMC